MKAKVTGVTAWQGTPTGGTLSIRAPRYVDSSGNASPEEYSAVLDVTHTPPRWMDALDPTRELYVIVQGPDDLPGVRARFYEVLHYGPTKSVRTEFTRKLISSDLSGLIFDYATPEPSDIPVGFGDAPLTMRAAQQVIEEGGAVVSEWSDIKVDIAQSAALATAAAGITPRTNLAAITGPDGYYRAMDTGYVYQRTGGSNTRRANLEAVSFDTLPDLYPWRYGAIGDGVADDTAAFNALVAANVAGRVRIDRPYRITGTINHVARSLSYVDAGGEIVQDSASLMTALKFDTCSGFEVTANVTSTKRANLWGTAAYAVDFVNCERFTVHNAEFSYFCDGVSVTTCTTFSVRDNRLHELGEEGVTIRSSSNWSVTGNDIYHHNGDGILVKGDGGLVQGNTLRDGVNTYGYGVIGGGITCNLEPAPDSSTPGSVPVRRMRVLGNVIRGTSYGVGLLGAQEFEVSGNVLDSITGLGIVLDTETTFNPLAVSAGLGSISGNTLRDITSDGIRVRSAAVATLPVVISGNVLRGTIASVTGQGAIRAQNCTVTGNIVEGVTSQRALQLNGGSATGNRISGTFSVETVALLNGAVLTGGNVISGDKAVYADSTWTGSLSGNHITYTGAAGGFVFNINVASAGYVGHNAVVPGAGTLFNPSALTSGSYINHEGQGNRIIIGLTPPSAGTWRVGDVTLSSDITKPFAGWRCVAAGTPGTWQQFGYAATDILTPTLSSTTINTNAGVVADVTLSTAGLRRWVIRKSADAETGGNTGSNLQIVRRADDGSLLDNPVTVDRKTGTISLTNAWQNPLTLSGLRLWQAGTGRLRAKPSAVTSDGDGAMVVYDTDLATTAAVGVVKRAAALTAAAVPSTALTASATYAQSELTAIIARMEAMRLRLADLEAKQVAAGQLT